MAGLRSLVERLVGRAGAAARPSRTLPFTMQRQLQTNWCWAACSSSTSAYFAAGSTWGQCTIVNGELKRPNCCTDGASVPCNIPWYLDRALKRTGNFASVRPAPASWDTVRAEIDRGRPVAARIGWQGGGGHFVVLTGYASGKQVLIQDPWTGSSTLPIETFTTAYKGTGTWTHTYLTEA